MNDIVCEPNEMLDLIKSRRSCRRYKADEVPEALLEEIIEAGLYAPSGMNRQPVVIAAITNKQVRDDLSELNREAGEMNLGTDPFYGAPAVLVVLADKNAPTYLYDGACAMENMLLAAHSLGLGSCWIHRAKETFETRAGKAILEDLGLEGDYEGIGQVIVGYKAIDDPTAAPRRDGRVFWSR